ncbi:MAG: hypothetical protein JWO04_416 [Gammaproteobacteria bacterium]|nr:hypothetical protein [Gammaproteobacteria bacterium]
MGKGAAILPFHLRMIVAYLVIAGFWSWGWLCWLVIGLHAPVVQNFGTFVLGLVIATAIFASAYAIYRRSKFAVPLLAVIPILQWIAFARLLPTQVSPSDFSLDFAYIRQLPVALKADLIYYIPLVVYTAFLWKRGELS